ncbi:MAG: hypothetical protein PHV85_04475 [Desulfovibrionaceae bacterium]|nr:hypothetical protein [Desulfovibrionaceae bacterium]MDD4951784.1 hypothetical protein [Desulfovibrionaceae bacterium]
MGDGYLLYKCGSGGRRKLITFIDARDLDEANAAVRLLKNRPERRADLELKPGEFFEVLEKSQVPQQEWDQVMSGLAKGR